MTRKGDILGCACVSAAERDTASQQVRQPEAGAIRVFTDAISGARAKRPTVTELINHARPGDRRGVARSDRVCRSLKQRLETVEDVKGRAVA